MLKTVYICHISGNVFEEIKYTDYTNLNEKLKLLIIQNDSDLFIMLLINNDILAFNVNTPSLIKYNFINNFDKITISKLSTLNDNDIITIVFNQKKELYCLGNKNGKYILDDNLDNYSKLLKNVIKFYKNNSYDIIINSSYKNLVLKAIKTNNFILEYININLLKDKEIILVAVEKNGWSLKYASIDLKNDKDVVLEAVKQYGNALQYASTDLKNDKDIVLEAVKQYGISLQYASTDLKNDKDIVLESVKQDGYNLQFASTDLKNNKTIVLEAVMQNGRSLQFASNNLQIDKDILLAINNIYLNIY